MTVIMGRFCIVFQFQIGIGKVYVKREKK